jgi:hypothetical protein
MAVVTLSRSPENFFPDMTEIIHPDFGALETGQLFRFQECLYRKQDQRTALLVRDSEGKLIEDMKTHTFYPEDLVEIVTEED